MRFCLLLLLLFGMRLLGDDTGNEPRAADGGRAVLVFTGPREINAISIREDTRVEVPLDRGKPDWGHGLLVNPGVRVNQSLGHIEVVRR